MRHLRSPESSEIVQKQEQIILLSLMLYSGKISHEYSMRDESDQIKQLASMFKFYMSFKSSGKVYIWHLEGT